jgi:hypothetical protein
MRPRVNLIFAARTACGAIAALLLAALPSSAQDRAAGHSIDERWIPSFAFTSGVFWGRQHATVSSDCRAPGSNPPAPTSCNPNTPIGSQLRQGAVDDELAATPYVGGNLSLLTPALASARLGRPRLFASLELPYMFGIDRNVAQKERPTGIAEPDNPNAGELLDEGALLGVGSRTRSEVQGLAFGANAGGAFAFEAFGKQFRVKPWAGWLRLQIGVRGRVEHGLCLNYCDVDGIQHPSGFGFTRVISLKAHDSLWLDGVGPGLDFEMDTGRFGPYTVSLFMGGGGYYLLGDRSVEFETQHTIGPDPLGAPVDYHAAFSFRVSPWLYRAGVGLRLSWVGYE